MAVLSFQELQFIKQLCHHLRQIWTHKLNFISKDRKCRYRWLL